MGLRVLLYYGDVHRPLHRDKAFVQAVMCTLDIEAEIGEKLSSQPKDIWCMNKYICSI